MKIKYPNCSEVHQEFDFFPYNFVRIWISKPTKTNVNDIELYVLYAAAILLQSIFRIYNQKSLFFAYNKDNKTIIINKVKNLMAD